MTNATHFPSDPVEMYSQNGFAIVKVFDENQVNILERFAKAWIYRLLKPWTSGKEDSLPLESYHAWSKSLNVDHANVFCANNRHMIPDLNIRDILINKNLRAFINEIGLKHYEIWDEGLGWLAFRFIRPGAGDGYPFSRKAWGPAVNVISCWIPVIGYQPSETLTLVPGSHVKDYEKHIPVNSKFRKGEYYLANVPEDLCVFNPELEKGEIIVFHPKTIHNEDVKAGNITRLSLEFRLNPLESSA